MLAAAEQKETSASKSGATTSDSRKPSDYRRADRKEKPEKREETTEDLKSKFPTIAQVSQRQRRFVAPRRGGEDDWEKRELDESTVVKAKPLPSGTARKLPGWKSKDFYSATSTDTEHVVGGLQEEQAGSAAIEEEQFDEELQKAARTDEEMNKLSAKILKAEMMGNQARRDLI